MVLQQKEQKGAKEQKSGSEPDLAEQDTETLPAEEVCILA